MAAVAEKDKVANFRLRREFLERRELGWLTQDTVARRMGWLNKHGHPDGTRVLRVLGIVNGHNCRGLQRKVARETAVKLAEALNVDPWQVGL